MKRRRDMSRTGLIVETSTSFGRRLTSTVQATFIPVMFSMTYQPVWKHPVLSHTFGHLPAFNASYDMDLETDQYDYLPSAADCVLTGYRNEVFSPCQDLPHKDPRSWLKARLNYSPREALTK